jgi:hypothetical protein
MTVGDLLETNECGCPERSRREKRRFTVKTVMMVGVMREEGVISKLPPFSRFYYAARFTACESFREIKSVYR